jgi:hypothetical protein
MGYRSEVAYKIMFYEEAQWNVFILEAKSKPETRACFEDECLTVDYDKRAIMFYADDVKWYDSYEDVQCHHDLMHLVDEYNDRATSLDKDAGYVGGYLFRRIGEAEEDIDTQHGGDPDWDWIELNRSLHVDWQA